jgi:hypothetical protein
MTEVDLTRGRLANVRSRDECCAAAEPAAFRQINLAEQLSGMLHAQKVGLSAMPTLRQAQAKGCSSG